MKGYLHYEPLDWKKDFVILPHRTISKRWVWGHCFSRTVWVSYGMGDEPETEYADIFDVLRATHE